MLRSAEILLNYRVQALLIYSIFYGASQIETTVIYPILGATGFWNKTNKIRFPSLLGVLTPKKVAEYVIDAHRRNKKEVAIPSFLFSMNNIFR